MGASNRGTKRIKIRRITEKIILKRFGLINSFIDM
jgi:hypothetical protein